MQRFWTYVLVVAAALYGVACDDRTPIAPVDETVDFVRVTPATPTLTVGDSVELAASAVAPDGDVLDGVTMAWTVSDGQAAALRTSGGRAWVRALRAGSVRVEARAAGKAAAATLTILNERPQLSAMNPMLMPAGSPALELTLLGSAYVPGAVVLWNGAVRPTTWVSPTQLRAHIPATDLAAVGVAQVRVANPSPAVGQSNVMMFRVAPVDEEYVEVLPATLTLAYGDTVRLSATVRDGQGVPVPGRTVTWASANNGIATVSASGLVTAITNGSTAIHATSGAAVGTAAVTVVAPANTPYIESISPESVPVRTDVEITIRGSGFLPTTTAYFNHGHRPTEYVSATELRMSLWEDEQDEAASGPVYVVNPGTPPAQSNSVTFSVVSALTSVRIDKVTNALFPGESTPLVAVPLNEKGEAMPAMPVTWEVQNTGVASISANGLVTAHGVGETFIQATIGDYTATTVMAVVAPPSSSDIIFDAPILGVPELWLVRMDGSDERTRLMPGVRAEDAAISPDGARIAYVGGGPLGDRDIWVADRNGTNRVRLTTDAQIDDQPAWSPDGSQIVFRSLRAGISEIWVMDANGGNQRRVTSGVYVGSPQFERPTFTPDGARIVYSYDDLGMPLNAVLVTTSVDGSDSRALVTSTGSENYEPAFSPDGQSLALRRATANGHDQILVKSADGERYSLIHVPVVGAKPAWSGDGKWLAYESPDVNGVVGVHVTAFGSGVHKLTVPGGRNPVWVER